MTPTSRSPLPVRSLGWLLTASFLVFLASLPVRAQTTHQIADADALRAVLSEGVAGDTLVLAPGRYGPLSLDAARDEVPAVIRSADPDDPAVLTGLLMRRALDAVLEDLVLSYSFDPEDRISVRPFDFRGAQGLVLRRLRVEGDVARGKGPTSDGLGYGIGLSIRGGRDVVIEDSHISLFYRGLAVREVRNITVRGNEFVDLRMDGMNFAQVEEVRIEGNLLHSFDRSTDPRDHADMIQFWTNRTETPSRDILIRGNVLNSSDGMFTQSIFMRNDLVDRGLAGDEMFYRNITIEENVIINAHLHGISVGETDGLIIRNNTLVQNIHSVGDFRPANHPSWVPTIGVNGESRRVRIENNVTGGLRVPRAREGWTVQDNLEVQNRTTLAPGYYGRVFQGMPQGDPRDIASFFYRPDGAAAAQGVGAALLQR